MPTWSVTWPESLEKEDVNSSFPISPAEFFECFDRALERMSLAVNSTAPRYRRYAEWLKYNDEDLKEEYKAQSLKPRLYRFGPPSEPDIDVSAREQAENYFYGTLRLRPFDVGKSTRRTLIEFTVTKMFLLEAYRSAERPPYNDEDYRLDDSNDSELLRRCATNYLLKNLWHNYVHNCLQHIDESNYHKFAGAERRRSDLEADNLANILLARSYGLPVETKGWSLPHISLIKMLRRNRCNKVFAARTEKRAQTLSPFDAFEENEWRYCRTLANYVSGWLLAQGRAAASLGVSLTGKVIRRGNGRYSRERSAIVVEVNGLRIPTDAENLLERFRGRLPGPERQEHFKDVARLVSNRYGVFLKENPQLYRYAKRTLQEKMRLAGLES